MPFELNIPEPPGSAERTKISIGVGQSAIFVGANGSGKTRLAAWIERANGDKAHRISAHRALKLNPKVAKISEQQALNGLRNGNTTAANWGYRINGRWGNEEATALLNDFDFVVQALFADQGKVTLGFYNGCRNGESTEPPLTMFLRLSKIWNRLLPHRRLDISGDDIRVHPEGPGAEYDAAALSDGERAIFYLIGQTLLAKPDSLLIVDEPELHVHRSIMADLWDELESARPDCAFVFVTHDLDFAASRRAQKFVVREYYPTDRWKIDEVPQNTGFSEPLATLILGSRRPVLFVEGEEGGLDVATYRCIFPDRTVVPLGSATAVRHSVCSMRRNAAFHRLGCAGIVDGDDYENEEVAALNDNAVGVLPVAEIESVFLLPEVARGIAEMEGYQGQQLDEVMQRLKDAVLKVSDDAIAIAAARQCRRRIDRALKRLDLSGNSPEQVKTEFKGQIASIKPDELAESASRRIRDAIAKDDLREFLRWWDGKALTSLAAKHLKGQSKRDFEAWLVRTLGSDNAEPLRSAIRRIIPDPQFAKPDAAAPSVAVPQLQRPPGG